MYKSKYRHRIKDTIPFQTTFTSKWNRYQRKGSACKQKSRRLRRLSGIVGSERCQTLLQSSSSFLKSMWVLSSVFSVATAPKVQQDNRDYLALDHCRERGTMRRMVPACPESIIEQASTQNLLDDLMVSVRTRYVCRLNIDW
jgi:hypothetical protein